MTTDKADYTGTLNAKKLGGTGITENILRRHHHDEGGTLVIVAAVSVASIKKNTKDGTGSVSYVIDDLEVAPTTAGAADYCRDLIKSFHYERKLTEDGPDLELGGPAPKVADVLAAGAKHQPHPYLASTLSVDDDAVCDVCGQQEPAAVHADRDQLDDPFAIPDDQDDEHTEDGDDGSTDTEEPGEPLELADGDEQPEPWEYDQPEPVA